VNPPVTFRPRARRDVIEQMLYLEEQANEEAAVRYYDAVVATCHLVAAQPLCGKIFETRVGPLEGLRRFPVSGAFSKYLIFYQSTPGGIDVVRVLHGSRDIQAILDEEAGV
jgi:toxin ParE1/3/4